MSFLDLERGNPTTPFVQRRKQKLTEQPDKLLGLFKESERRLTILRSFTGANHEPSDEEMKRWICSTRKSKPPRSAIENAEAPRPTECRGCGYRSKRMVLIHLL